MPDAERPLLIVPYGIETITNRNLRALRILLIVPYGIETWQPHNYYQMSSAFNRTLWN